MGKRDLDILQPTIDVFNLYLIIYKDYMYDSNSNDITHLDLYGK